MNKEIKEIAMPYTVGLTGGIGAGKSTVARLFSELGVEVINTDDLNAQLIGCNGQAMPQIIQAFGANFCLPNGSLNRPLMRQLIFTQSEAKKKIEAILHPLILNLSLALYLKRSSSYVIWEVPLLFENPHFLACIRRSLLITLPRQQKIARVMSRSGLTETEVGRIIDSQLTDQKKREKADDIISNEGNLTELTEQVVNLHAFYQHYFAY
ncbi:MAG: dephospho-CoA kinase [Neisseriaceae bacterium]|nr:dephospho-CoA kinase [Neisseriaceae bacterium]